MLYVENILRHVQVQNTKKGRKQKQISCLKAHGIREAWGLSGRGALIDKNSG